MDLVGIMLEFRVHHALFYRFCAVKSLYKNQIDLKLKLKTEFHNVWGECKISEHVVVGVRIDMRRL